MIISKTSRREADLRKDMSETVGCSCSLCGSTQFSVSHRKDPWRYLRCLHCGLVLLYPRPAVEDLLHSYDDYLPTEPEEIGKWETMMKPVIIKSADLIETHHSGPHGSILDIGCGYGFFLREMQSRGWNVTGIEISETGRHYALTQWGIPVHSQPMEQLDLESDVFDVVTLFYVIEHVDDPPALLAEVRRVLKPGGLVLLRWPHTTPIVRILGPLSRKFDLYHTPYHLYDFSPGTIKALLDKMGFTGIKTMNGGYTLPARTLGRITSIISGQLGEVLYRMSGGRFLLPGLSKTTVALKNGTDTLSS